MGRRGVLVAAAAAVLVVVAAASGPVHVWTTPAPQLGREPVGTLGASDTIAAPVSVAEQATTTSGWSGALLQIVGVLIILAAVLAVISMRRSLRPRPRRALRRRRGRYIGALPELAEEDLAIDVDAARIALGEGEPRNAIVACWIQLERDAAAAGLPRAQAETSAEYAERVVAVSSVDSVPIGELAALYREARFSQHSLNDDHRARAYTALDRVAAALRRGAKVVA